MAMVRWDPFNEMMTVQRDMNRLFSSLGMPLYTSRGDGERVAWMPTVDVIRSGDDLVVRAEIPGVAPQDVDISVTDDVLTIKGRREEHEETGRGDYIRKESSFGAFERQVMLPQGARTGDITAEYRDGVVEVVVPGAARHAEPQTRRIPIAAGGQRVTGGTASQASQSSQGAGAQVGPPGEEQARRIRVGAEDEGRQDG